MKTLLSADRMYMLANVLAVAIIFDVIAYSLWTL